MFFGLDARVLDMGDLDRVVDGARRVGDGMSELPDRELLGELIEDAELARFRRIEDHQLDAAQGVADIEQAADLVAQAVERQRAPEDGLRDKPVEHRPEDGVVVEAGVQSLGEGGLVGFQAVDHPLVQIRDA
jgi:hypothetical protein